MNRWFLKNKGFTLVEVMIAIVVLSVALLALAGLQIVSIRGNSFGNRMTEALTLAKDLMEEMKNEEWGDIVDWSDDWPPPPEPPIYHRVCSVMQSGNIKTVTVTVSWDNGNHRVALVTKIADLRANP
jgi:prepilin-type N-terminal cleavage/methylation domain-containing protein